MRLVKETQGGSLIGAVDGSNTSYTASQTISPALLSVYVNGRLKVAGLDDGYVFIAPRTIVLKEPLQVGDTLEVEYATADLGGSSGSPIPPGVPSMPSAVTLKPQLTTGLLRPVGVYTKIICDC